MNTYTLSHFQQEVMVELEKYSITYEGLEVSFWLFQNRGLVCSVQFMDPSTKTGKICCGVTPSACLQKLEETILASGKNLSVQVPE